MYFRITQHIILVNVNLSSQCCPIGIQPACVHVFQMNDECAQQFVCTHNMALRNTLDALEVKSLDDIWWKLIANERATEKTKRHKVSNIAEMSFV